MTHPHPSKPASRCVNTGNNMLQPQTILVWTALLGRIPIVLVNRHPLRQGKNRPTSAWKVHTPGDVIPFTSPTDSPDVGPYGTPCCHHNKAIMRGSLCRTAFSPAHRATLSTLILLDARWMLGDNRGQTAAADLRTPRDGVFEGDSVCLVHFSRLQQSFVQAS